MTEKTRYDIDKLLLMWEERANTLNGKKLRYEDVVHEFSTFLSYTFAAITELNQRTKDKA